jgi:hypothetical protein
MRRKYNVDLEPLLEFIKENADLSEIIEFLGETDVMDVIGKDKSIKYFDIQEATEDEE